MPQGRRHIVLVPGFAGFDALGQMEYYAGVTAHFRAAAGRRSAVLHYFDNFPTAAVATRAARLRNYLAKRIVRGEFAPSDRLALVGHSTGGLDIRRMLWDLARDARSRRRYALDGVTAAHWKIAPQQILGMIRRVVFLSVPQWGTNLAAWVQQVGLLRKLAVDGLRALVAGSQVPLLEEVEQWFAGSVVDGRPADLIYAIRDALGEAEPACGGIGERGAMAQEAASELCLWLRHIASDCAAIDDLTPWRASEGDTPEPASPAHFSPALREQEWDCWKEHGILTRSYATLGPPPDQRGVDLAYRICHNACARGPFEYPGKIPQPRAGFRRCSITAADNDGIVNTASMLWPNGAASVLVHCDHMDIVGHHSPVPAAEECGRKHRAYDLLGSQSRFHGAAFARVWKDIFNVALD